MSSFPLTRWVPAVAGVFLFAAVAYLVQPEADFHHIYWPKIRAWLFEGHPLYGEGAYGFYNPPWTSFFLLPFVLLPEQWGRAALAGFSMGVIFWATAYFYGEGRGRLLALGLVLPSLHTLYVTIGGQVDAFPLLGVLLGWRALESISPSAPPEGKGLALIRPRRTEGLLKGPWLLSLSFLLLSIKPQVVILIIVLFLLSLKRLAWRERLAALSLIFLAFVVSLPLFGVDWPLGWWRAYRAQPPYPEYAVTTWRAAKELGLPLWVPFLAVASVLTGTVAAYLRRGPSKDMVGLALLSGALSTYYASPSASLLVLAVSFPRLLAARPFLAFPIYLLSLTPFLRLTYALSGSWIDVAFWWALWLALFPTLMAPSNRNARPEAS